MIHLGDLSLKKEEHSNYNGKAGIFQPSLWGGERD
jgi:hypothetical protein